MSWDRDTALKQLDAALAAKKITAGAAKNIRDWLTEPWYGDYAPEVAAELAAGKFKELDDAFWTIIPFGTGGRRGKMYPIGTNAINDRTIGESAQGLADYVAKTKPDGLPLSCAIAYDTRHRSLHFAQLCAEIMAAAGFQVWFFDSYRSTPELSFAVRFKKCSCGIMVTASHNPPSDNAVKVYWSTGGQLLPPHDKNVIAHVNQVRTIQRTPFDDAVKAGKVVYCQAEVDPAYVAAAAQQALGKQRNLSILYSPLHGVGATAALPVLAAAGFKQVASFGPHSEPNGDFPNVPGHVSNPENPRVFDIIIEQAKTTDVDVILATDPDCDRLGCAAPRTVKTAKTDWGTFTGNQIASLLADYVLDARKQAGKLSSEHYLVKTLVTTEMLRRIATSYGVRCYGDLQVGFKWIGAEMDARGANLFVLGAEESHGYLAGQYARDKDGAVASLLLAELAAKLKAEGKTLHERLDDLYWQFGCHLENTVSIAMEGSQGMDRMKRLMAGVRAQAPKSLAGFEVVTVRDYEQLTVTWPHDAAQQLPLSGPKGDMVILDLAADGNYVAIRPSGTEPKVKLYMFTYEPAEQLHNLDDAKGSLRERMAAMEKDLRGFAQAF
jgi:phosphoglucomutase/phosphomannomutase